MKILTVFGTRPEAIKLAPVISELTRTAGVEQAVCVTAQHREMLDQVLSFFGIRPDFDLNIMRKGQDLFDVTTLVLSGVREIIQKKFRPDWIVVHGDTTTCMAAALAGFYAGVKIAHVEAGLRTGNLQAPFPEEANRIIADRLANALFAPTETNHTNLLREGIPEDRIVVTGNTVIDALNYSLQRISGFSHEVSIEARATYASGRQVVLITGHRRENFGDGFREICNGIRRLALEHPDVFFHYPVHLNPNVQGPVRDLLAHLPNVILDVPMGYPDFVYAMKHSACLLTDSGGVQEEAIALNKKVFVMRDVTERAEGLSSDFIELVGAHSGKIYHAVTGFLTGGGANAYLPTNPFGDGKAAGRIVEYLVNH